MSFGNHVIGKTSWKAKLVFYEECNCGDDIRHNNGGNYHSRVWECEHPDAERKVWFEVDTRDFGHDQEICLLELPCGCPAVGWRNPKWDNPYRDSFIHLAVEEPGHNHDWGAVKDYAHSHGTWFDVEDWSLSEPPSWGLE